ncbi:hypothetical protein BASA81_007738 [Batrachochytrium salamandrivorans]|nr:hypothetical protein BASA81_007738 [Batrachochytrium salamandrivorans]
MSFKQFSNALGISQLTPAFIIKQICVPNSTVSFGDYLAFWNSLQRTQSLATKMLGEVILKICEVQRVVLKRLGKLKASQQAGAEDEFRALWTLTNIVRFIDLFLGVEVNNPALRKSQKHYETHRHEFKGDLFDSLFGEMDLSLSRSMHSTFESTTKSNEEYLEELVVMNTSQWSTGDYSCERDLSFQVTQDFSLQALRMFSKLTQQQGGQESFTVFALLVSKLHSLSVRSITPGGLESLSALLFILTEAITSYPIVDPQVSQQLEQVVGKFLYWPIPFGSSARKLIELIQLERIHPGQALRQRIQLEHPILTPLGLNLSEKFAGQCHEWSAANRQITVLHNNSAKSNVLRKLIARPLNKGRAFTQEQQVLKEDMLIQLMECELTDGKEDGGVEWHSEVVQAIRNRQPQELNAIFTRAFLNRKESTLTLAQSLGMKRVFERPKEDRFDVSVATKPLAFVSSTWPQQQIRIPNLSFDFLELAPLVGMARRTMTALTTETMDGASLGKKSLVPNNRKVGRMSLTIPGLEMFATVNGMDAFQNDEHTCPQQYIAYLSDFDELLREVRQVLPPGGQKTLLTMETGSKPVLRRVLLGGQDVLHRAVSTYCALLAIDPELASQVKFEFYLVPSHGKVDLAAFIAQRDGWYRKQVFAPFCNHGGLLIHPTIKPERDDLLANNLGGLKGSSFVGKSSDIRRTSFKNAPPSAFDSDYQHEVQDTDSVLETLEEPGGFDKLQQDAKRHKFDAVPGKLLRPLLENFIRQAHHELKVHVFDCECWESIDSIEADRNPDVTIPFVSRVELGLHCAIQQMNNQLQEQHIQMMQSEDDVVDQLGLEAMLMDKHFIKSVSGGANAELKITTPELTVHMYTMGVDGRLLDYKTSTGLELADASYLSLTLANAPKYTWPDRTNPLVRTEAGEPPGTTANPLFPWIEVQCVQHRSALVDLVRKKEKKPRDVENVTDCLKYDAKTHHAGFVDIRSTLSSRMPFFISVDGQVFGPYYRVRVRRSTALSTSGGQGTSPEANDSPIVHFPLMTFLPFES